VPGKREAQYHASIPSADLSQALTAEEAPGIRTLWLRHRVMAHPHPSVDAVFLPGRSAPYANLAKQAVAARGYRFSPARRTGIFLRLRPLMRLTQVKDPVQALRNNYSC